LGIRRTREFARSVDRVGTPLDIGPVSGPAAACLASLLAWIFLFEVSGQWGDAQDDSPDALDPSNAPPGGSILYSLQ
jgi:hypothetical protein